MGSFLARSTKKQLYCGRARESGDERRRQLAPKNGSGWSPWICASNQEGSDCKDVIFAILKPTLGLVASPAEPVRSM